jgi:hypothetical protein
MANFQMTITSAGLSLLARGLTGDGIRFTEMVMGDAAYSGSAAAVSEVISPQYTLTINRMTRKNDQVTLRSVLSFREVETGFHWRELGLYAADPDGGKDILYAYGNAGADGDYIPGADEATLNERLIQLTVAVASAPDVTAAVDGSGIFVEYDELDAAIVGVGVLLLEHQKVGSVHQLTGLSRAEGDYSGLLLGRFLATGDFAEGDSCTVDGVAYTIQMNNGEPPEDDLFVTGAGVEAVLDTGHRTVNFKAGGGLTKSKLSLATATPEQVFGGYTFYAGDKTLQTGTGLSEASTAEASDILSGKTAYNSLGQLLTGSMSRVVQAGTVSAVQQKTYTISYNNSLGAPKLVIAWFSLDSINSFSPYLFQGAATGAHASTSIAGRSGNFRNQNQSMANSSYYIGTSYFSFTVDQYDYLSGGSYECSYVFVW